MLSSKLLDMPPKCLYLNIFKNHLLRNQAVPILYYVAFCHFSCSELPNKDPYVIPLAGLMSSADVPKASGKTDVK